MFRNWAGEMAQGKMVAGLSLITNMAKKNWLQQVVPGPLPHAITCVFYHLSACLSTIWLSVCLSAYISTYLSSSCINQSIIYLSTYLPPICLSLYLLDFKRIFLCSPGYTVINHVEYADLKQVAMLLPQTPSCWIQPGTTTPIFLFAFEMKSQCVAQAFLELAM